MLCSYQLFALRSKIIGRFYNIPKAEDIFRVLILAADLLFISQSVLRCLPSLLLVPHCTFELLFISLQLLIP